MYLCHNAFQTDNGGTEKLALKGRAEERKDTYLIRLNTVTMHDLKFFLKKKLYQHYLITGNPVVLTGSESMTHHFH